MKTRIFHQEEDQGAKHRKHYEIQKIYNKYQAGKSHKLIRWKKQKHINLKQHDEEGKLKDKKHIKDK